MFVEWVDDNLTSIVELCPNIVNLDLQYCHSLTDAGVHLVATKLHHLRALNLLECSSITDISMSTLADHCRLLKVLHMGENVLCLYKSRQI